MTIIDAALFGCWRNGSKLRQIKKSTCCRVLGGNAPEALLVVHDAALVAVGKTGTALLEVTWKKSCSFVFLLLS